MIAECVSAEIIAPGQDCETVMRDGAQQGALREQIEQLHRTAPISSTLNSKATLPQ